MWRKLLSTVAIGAMCVHLSACGAEVVETGERGVETNFGEVVSESLPEGLYFYNPLTSNISTLDVKTQVRNTQTQVYTKDIQQANIYYTVNYRLEDVAAHLIFKEVGRNWEEKILPQILEGTIKNVIGQWDAVDLIANRQKATSQIQVALTDKLASRHIIVENFEVNNIDYTGEFEQAVEAKVTAVQRAAESQNKTIQVEEEAKQRIITAKAEAESMRIRANALTQNKALVEYEAVQKWNGVMPTMVLGDGALPFINIK